MSSFLDRNPIVEWVFIKGELVAQSAFSIGSDEEGVADQMVLRESDGLDSKPFIPGTSFAGALRSRLMDAGLSVPEITMLLGAKAEDSSKNQSSLLVNECFCCGESGIPRIALRDGIALEEDERIAKTGAKYDFEVVEAKTPFTLHLELSIRKNLTPAETGRLKALVNSILATLTIEGILLGSKTSRGLGHFILNDPEVYTIKAAESTAREKISEFTWDADGFSPWRKEDGTELLKSSLKTTTYEVEIPQSLLIRDYSNIDSDADATMFMATHYGEELSFPLIPGTSWGGFLRSASREALLDINLDAALVTLLLRESFGLEQSEASKLNSEQKPIKSALIINESEIEESTPLIKVNRIPIDRFTSGVVKGLFLEEEVIARITTKLTIHYQEEWQRELIEFALLDANDRLHKLGGEAAIGRGICFFKGLKLTADKDGHIESLEHLSKKILEKMKTLDAKEVVL